MDARIRADLDLPIIAAAPFNDVERRWLIAFVRETLDKQMPTKAPPKAPAEEETTPWKDPAMPLAERMTLAIGRPLLARMTAAVAQQDCGQCGYTCADYSRAIFEQAEPRLNLCAPGGKATARMLKALVEEMGGGVLDPDEQAAKAANASPPKSSDARPGYSRDAPVSARLVGRRRLNGDGSEKTTMHIEIDISDSGPTYEVGDSLGVFALNPPDLADAVIAAIDAPADFPIAGKSLRDVLIEDMSLGAAPDALLQFISYLTGGERRQKARAMAKGEDVDGDLETLDVLAALEKFPGIRPDPEAFVEVLEPIQPRLYSISSSPKAHAGRVTLTVDVVRFAIAERERHGVASTFLGLRHDENAAIKVYVQKAHGFALPADPATPIIMIGPGTGVAPFRAFLQERKAIAAPGKAWLFYGHQHSATDFFYADDFADLQESGALHRLSLAWSRDGVEKIYVQHRMREEAAELYAWLEGGAHFYVCGDAKRMARDVETALADIIMAQGRKSLGEAQARIAQLRSTGQFQTDVY
jgi:sulfite reductase (NADPH) flavoprotein alpha-component